MKTVYGIYDEKAKDIIGPLFVAHADPVAMRNFADIVRDKQSMIARHPEDYQLLAFGHLDAETPKVEPERGRARVVITALQIVAMDNPQDAGAVRNMEREADKRQLDLLKKEA